MTSSGRALSLEVIGLSKRFGSFTALDDVSLKVQAGGFHALLGENGAGKSTLVKCVIGFHPPTQGDVLINDRAVRFGSPRAAHAAGIGMVYQRFMLVEQMTVAENLVLTRPRVPAIVDFRKEHAALEKFMASMPFSLPLDHKVYALSAGERQKLEILKQLYVRSALLFLDEPTSVLTPDEADEVLGLLHGFAKRGELTVLMITHKLREVLQFADHVSVLRRGKLVGSAATAETSPEQLTSWMMGEEKPRPKVASTESRSGATLLRLAKLCARDDMGMPAIRDVDLDVRAGEIVGMAGVSGNGQTELVEALSGQRPLTGGEVAVAGKPFEPADRAAMRERGVSILPEVPLDNACVPSLSVSENLTLREFDVPPILRAGSFISKKALRERAALLISRYRVKCASPEVRIRELSGGNVQRAVLARELSSRPEVLIAQNPCFGLDVGAASEIRSQIVDARNRGAAVLLISEDLDELLELADRIVVMFDGALVYETKSEGARAADIGRHMAGHG